MATLNLKSFTTLVSDQVAAIQSRASALLDFSIGSVLRSLVESNSAVVLWLESMVLQVLATTRAATSTGTDLDSFVGDFGVTRNAGVASSGIVTFSRFTPTLDTLIPVGVSIQTSDGTQKFIVVADTDNPDYDAGQGGYVLPSAATSVGVTVNSISLAAAANVLAGTITVLTTAVPGVDTITNPSAMTGGRDSESDAALRARFRAYIASLAKATLGAIAYAIISTQAGLYYSIVENIDYATGAEHRGYFYVILDDGTGSPSAGLITAVYEAVDAVRAASVQFEVKAPTIVTATIVLTATIGSSYDGPTIRAVVQAAVDSYVNNLAVGTDLPITRIIQIAYDASPGVTNVSGVTINGLASDLAAGPSQVIKTSSVTVS